MKNILKELRKIYHIDKYELYHRYSMHQPIICDDCLAIQSVNDLDMKEDYDETGILNGCKKCGGNSLAVIDYDIVPHLKMLVNLKYRPVMSCSGHLQFVEENIKFVSGYIMFDGIYKLPTPDQSSGITVEESNGNSTIRWKIETVFTKEAAYMNLRRALQLNELLLYILDLPQRNDFVNKELPFVLQVFNEGSVQGLNTWFSGDVIECTSIRKIGDTNEILKEVIRKGIKELIKSTTDNKYQISINSGSIIIDLDKIHKANSDILVTATFKEIKNGKCEFSKDIFDLLLLHGVLKNEVELNNLVFIATNKMIDMFILNQI